MRRIILLLIAGCLLLIGVQAQTMPSVTLHDLQGRAVTVDTLSNGGKPILISFFATWCKPCMRELKAIHELYPDWQDETGVKLIAVSIDDTQNSQKVKPLVEGNGWEYEVLLDENSDLKRALNIQLIPHTLLLDGKGQIVYQHSGYTDGGEEELYQEIKKLN